MYAMTTTNRSITSGTMIEWSGNIWMYLYTAEYDIGHSVMLAHIWNGGLSIRECHSSCAIVWNIGRRRGHLSRWYFAMTNHDLIASRTFIVK